MLPHIVADLTLDRDELSGFRGTEYGAHAATPGKYNRAIFEYPLLLLLR